MITVSIAGRLTKDAELRQAGNSQVCGFSVAADTGFGDKKQAHFFSCSLWGNQGAAIAQYLRKGTPVTISGEYSEREYDGKQYKELRVNQIELQGSKGDNQNNQQGYQQPTQNNQAPNPYAQQVAQNAQGMQNQVNQQFANANQNTQLNQNQQANVNAGFPPGPVDDDIPFAPFYDGQF